ncbi:class F sortase [Actinotalea fermentans]|uniref:Class F sortase n=1 Tax=Actinotalea fermentans TaxID=43671 RepID=A0A511Z1D2_9CELL|nr:class F sortase [Actinotalea fermentans]GEN81261.1 hypothetical protein AFE02nite_29950 [Actinotalea fermentans]
MTPEPAPGGRRRRRTQGAVAATLALGLLAGCAAEADDAAPLTRVPATSTAPTPAPAPPADVPDVPVSAATLPPAEQVVPPTGLAIDALGIALPVEPVGVQPDGQMEIPPQAEVAGWYRFGAAPGDPDGTVVIAAHVDSVASAGLGPFAKLGDLAVGDAVSVTRADGAVVTYAVTGRSSVAKPEVAWGDVFLRDGGPRLVLVTCGGVWHQDRRSYSDNVIVTAEPIG